jgi:hypothetical protein
MCVMGRRKTTRGRALALVAAAAGAFALAGPAQALAGTGPSQTGTINNSSSLSGATAIATSGSYAYVAAYYAGQLVAVNIANPVSPTVAGASPVASSLFNSTNVAVSGGYAYVVSKNRNASSTSNDDGTGNSLTVLDISSNPAQPQIVGTLKDAVNLFGAYGIAISGNYAYIAAQGCLAGQPCPNPNVGDSFAVVNIGNPRAPTLVATLKNSALPSPWTGTNALRHATSVAISGNYAYVTASYSNRLTVIDISNPSIPKIVASLHDATNLNFDVDVAAKGNYAYVADQASGLGRLAVVDVSKPSSPKIAGTATNSTYMNGAYRVRLGGNFAYVSGVYSASIGAVDVSDPKNPRFAGGYANPATLNRTTGLDVDPSGRYLEVVSPYLSTQSRVDYPPYPGQPNGPTITGTVTTVDLNPNAISATIAPASEPPNPTTQTTASFTFSTNDDVSTVRCSLDGAAFGLCTSATTASYSGLANGSHTFTVEAIDASGNVASDSYTWTVNGSGGGGGGPTSPVLDNFNRANGGAGSNWSVMKPTSFATMNVSGNQAVDSSTSLYAWNFWTPSTFGPDSEAYVTIANYVSTDTIRVGARVTGGGTSSYSGYYVSVNSSGVWSIIRVTNGGSPTTLATGPTLALASGTRIGIQVVGSVITAWRDTGSGWQQVMSYDTSGDATKYTAAGNIAVEFKASTIDDFGGGTVSGGGGGTSAPTNTALPTVSGSATVGSQLTASQGTWTGSPTSYAYQWQRCDSQGASCNPLSGQTSSTYTVVSGDVGFTLEVTVTATNTGGSTPATSNPTAVVTSGGGGGGGGGPSTPILDNFNRANGGAGSNWSVMKPTSFALMNISNNQAVDSSSTLYAWNFWNASTFGPDSEAYATVASYSGSDTIRIGARVTGGGTSSYSGYFVSISTTGAWSIIRITNGGSPVTLKSGVTQTLSSGDRIGIQVIGSVVTAWHDTGSGWQQVMSYDTSGDATKYTGAGNVAVEFRSSTIDDFGGGTI